MSSTDPILPVPDPVSESPGGSRRGWRAVPWGLLGMLALVAAIESLVTRDWIDFSDPVSLNWRLAARSARDEAPRRDVLCAGDSLVKHALIPKVIHAQSGHTAVNLALAQGPAPATYFLFRRALRAGARPAALVVDYKPNVLIGGPRYNLRYWQELLTFGESLELARAAGSGSFFIEVAVGQLLPSFRSRHEVRSYIQAALRGEPDPLRAINLTCHRNWTLNDGANVAARNPAFHGVLGPEAEKTYQTRAFRCHRVNAAYIRRLLALAEEHGVAVYWLLPPLAPELQGRREQNGAEAGFVKFVRTLQAAAPHATVLDARHSGYGPSLFVDASHLDGQGAYTLSRDVADILRHDHDHVVATAARAGPARAGIAPGRWIDLPAYRACPVDVVLEDVEQSRRALTLTR